MHILAKHERKAKNARDYDIKISNCSNGSEYRLMLKEKSHKFIFNSNQSRKIKDKI